MSKMPKQTIRKLLAAAFLLNIAVIVGLALFAPRSHTAVFTEVLRDMAKPNEPASSPATQKAGLLNVKSLFSHESEAAARKQSAIDSLIDASEAFDRATVRWNILVNAVSFMSAIAALLSFYCLLHIENEIRGGAGA